MGLGLRIHGRSKSKSFDRVFSRLPVLIGRDVFPTECRLEEPEVSKLHASVDVRDGQILLKDAGSRNGTHVGGRRVEANQWLTLGPADGAAEIRIGDFQLHLVPQRVVGDEAGLRDANGAWTEMGGTSPLAKKAIADAATVLGPAQRRDDGNATFNMQDPIVDLVPLFTKLTEVTRDVRDRVARKLEGTPAAARPYICSRLAVSFPMMTTDPELLALLQRNGWSPNANGPLSTAAIPPSARAAQQALDDLARAYLGPDRALATPGEVNAFRDKLRMTLDELLVGYIPLLQGLERFEDQLAVQQSRPGAKPRGAAELARSLLEWRDQTGEPHQRLRSNFAELMMHQAAVLNAVMKGVRVLLAELSPAAIEKSASRDITKLSWFSRLFAAKPNPWTVYKSRHADLADEENERFRLLFGPEFAEEYKQFVQEARDLEGSQPRR